MWWLFGDATRSSIKKLLVVCNSKPQHNAPTTCISRALKRWKLWRGIANSPAHPPKTNRFWFWLCFLLFPILILPLLRFHHFGSCEETAPSWPSPRSSSAFTSPLPTSPPKTKPSIAANIPKNICSHDFSRAIRCGRRESPANPRRCGCRDRCCKGVV